MSKYKFEEMIHKIQSDFIKYGSFAHTLSQLDPLSESFKQMEAFALKMKKEQDDHIKYGSFVHTLSKLDPLSENFKQMKAFALKMKKEQDDHIKYGSFVHTLSKLDPLSENFKQMEAFALKIKKEQDDHIKYGGFAHTLSQLDPLSESFKQMEAFALKMKKELHSFLENNNIQNHLNHLLVSSSSLSVITANLSNTFLEQYSYSEFIEECTFASGLDDDTQISNNKLNTQNNILKLIFINLILPILLGLITNYIYEFHLQPLVQAYHSAKSEKEVKNHIKTNTHFDKSLLVSYRITSKPLALHTSSNLKSPILESISSFTLIQRVEESNLHKSWLKVQVEINGEIIEGYVLRRYTSPIK